MGVKWRRFRVFAVESWAAAQVAAAPSLGLALRPAIRRHAMTRALRTISIFFLVTSWALGQQSGKAATAGNATDQTLQKRFSEYADALTKRDTAALDRIWASDYTFINPQG